MMRTDIDPTAVERVCRLASAPSEGHVIVDVLADPLDGSVWVRMASRRPTDEAGRALTDFGLAVTHIEPTRLHVTGWDPRLLRRRLGGLLAAVDDLKIEWGATAELAAYFYDQRADRGEEPDPVDVLAEVETTMRRAVPIPHRTPHIDDVVSLLDLIAAAEDAYEQLIWRHVDHAERFLATRTTSGTA
jgi:hypothetical protein